ncbi:MAG TPA: hypothetical protein DD490_02940 [Acidobacteria bacterium]|nr:hypothetical protein [Acidobacteriota bacterium]
MRQQAFAAGGGAETGKLLGDALNACRETWKGLSRDQQPVPWAVATLDLANVTADRAILGGGANSVKGLDEAIDLYRQALAAVSDGRSPEIWSAAQMNLGSALQSRGIRTAGEAAISFLQEAAEHLRQALTTLKPEKEAQDWAETQNNLGLTLAELGSRQGKPTGAPRLEEAFQAFGAVQTVYTFEKQPRRWSEARLAQARVLLALDKADEAAPVLKEITDKDLDNRRAMLTYASLLGGRLAKPADAAALSARYLERHPDDVEVQVLNLENLFAAGRLAESRYRSVSLSEKSAGFPPALRAQVLGYEIATGLGTGTKDTPERLASLIALVAAQAPDFRTAGSFTASLRYLQARPDARNADWQIQLLHALQNRNGRDAILAELRKLESAMSGEG